MKVRFQLAFIFLVILTCASAQSEAELDSIMEAQEEPSTWQKIDKGAYLNLNGKMMSNPDGYQPSLEIGFGVSFSFVELGFFVSQFHGQHTRRLIFPNEFKLDYLSGGIQLGLKVFQRRYFESQLNLGYGWGDMTWTPTETGEVFSRDVYGVFLPELRLAFVPVNFVTLYLQPGFRVMNGLKLSGLTTSEFNGFTLGTGLTIRLHQ